MKKLVFLFLICSSLAAQDGGVPNLSDRPLAKTRYFDLFIDLLYWQPSEPVDWAYTLSVNGGVEQVAYKMISFGWDPGFRVGLGYQMEYDQWDTQLSYTRFQSATHSQTTGNITSIFLGSKTALYNSYENAKINWKLQFNLFDLDLGRSFWISHALSLRPCIGVKAGWIDQTIDSQWINPLVLGFRVPLTAKENIEHDFLGGGPKGGVRGKWVLGCIDRYSFSLLGDLASSYLWGNWTITDKFRGSLTSVSTNIGNRTFGSFVLQGLLGIGLDWNIRREQSHISIKLGYEFQDWFSQFQAFDNGTGGHNNDLILQGATFDIHFDF
jgi:hypothetical protein